MKSRLYRPWSDDEIVELVWKTRLRYGACTLGALIKQTGYSKGGIAARITALIEEGRLVVSPEVDGSLRTADELRTRDPSVAARLRLPKPPPPKHVRN